MAGKNRKKKKLIIIILLIIVLIAGLVTAVVIKTGNAKEEEIAYKETTAEIMNLTTGITESGSVSIGTVSQALDLDSISVTLTTSDSSSGSGATSSSQNGMSAMGDTNVMAGGATQSMSGSAGTGNNMSAQSSSSVSGTEETSLLVEEIYVAAGQYVEKGEAILKIEAESLNEYKEGLESAVTTAQLNLKQEQLSMELEQLSAQYTYEINIEKGKVAYETYLAELEQLEKSENVDTTEAKLQAKQTYEETMINYNNASGILAIDTDGLAEDVENAKETLAEAQEALDKFNACMGDGTIYADCSGKIMQVCCAEGDSLSGSSELVVYANAEDVTMAVSVSQEDISKIALGNIVNIELTAYEDEIFTGTVIDINTATSTGTSTVNYTVTVAFSGDTTKVFSGMTGSVTFVEKEVKDVLAVSKKAIINEGTLIYVKVKNANGSIEKKEVQTGFSDGLNIEITNGLSEGEIVIIESKVKSQ